VGFLIRLAGVEGRAGEVQDLIKGKHLLIVPSGPLTQLPFQLLVTTPPASSDHRTVAWHAQIEGRR
jgi:hypothetical protein